jgi:glycerate kinase
MALGVGLYDRAGAPLRRGGLALRELDRIDLAGRDPRLAEVRIVVARDVAHHLLGDAGAARAFGPQKGADDHTVRALDAALERFAEVTRRDLGCDPRSVRGGGAAGGFAAGAVAMLGAQLVVGIDIVLDLLDFNRIVAGADLVVTGEGSLDAQSLLGKAPVGVALRAARLGVPTVAVAGRCGVPPQTLHRHGISAVTTMSELAGGTAASMADPRRWAATAGQHLARHALPALAALPALRDGRPGG